jgi:hypothetical protein
MTGRRNPRQSCAVLGGSHQGHPRSQYLCSQWQILSGSDKFAYKLAWMDRQPRRMYSGSEALSLNPLMDTGRAADGRDRKLSEKS